MTSAFPDYLGIRFIKHKTCTVGSNSPQAYTNQDTVSTKGVGNVKRLDDTRITGTQVSQNIIFKGEKLELGMSIKQNRDAQLHFL